MNDLKLGGRPMGDIETRKTRRQSKERKENSTLKAFKGLIGQDQRGFTLIELIVVIAILGILAAIAVPVITSYLGASKERAYEADASKVQVAVDAYYSKPGNSRFTGKRQYPNYAQLYSGSSSALLTSNAGIDEITTLGASDTNPVGGTQGGTPLWEDTDGDGLRATTGEKLHYLGAYSTPATDHWNTTKVTRGTTDYEVDSRDWFIRFEYMTSDGQLKDVPQSGSADNKSGEDGSYSWYIDSNGKVKSVYYFFPLTSNTGYQETYP